MIPHATEPGLTSALMPRSRGEPVVPCPHDMTPEQIERACRGDDERLEALVGDLIPTVRLEVTYGLRRRARLYGRDADQDVDDFVQDVMVHLLADDGKRLLAWDPARGRSLRSFVRLIARQRMTRVLDGFRGNPWEGSAVDDPSPPELTASARAETFDRILSRQQLEKLLDQLRARFNERSLLVFELIYIEQRPLAEVCTTMGMTRGAVDQWNVRLRRLVRQLANELDRPVRPAPTQPKA